MSSFFRPLQESALIRTGSVHFEVLDLARESVCLRWRSIVCNPPLIRLESRADQPFDRITTDLLDGPEPDVSDVPEELAGLSEALARSKIAASRKSESDLPMAEVVSPPIIPAVGVNIESTIEAIVVDEAIHIGSPFAETRTAEDRHLARGAATASLAVGLWGLATFWISYAAIVDGLLGIALGLWGIRSNLPRRATIGLVASLLTLLTTVAWWTFHQSGR